MLYSVNVENSDESTLLLQDTCNANTPVLEDNSELNPAETNLVNPDESTLVLQDTCNADALEETSELNPTETNSANSADESTPFSQDTSEIQFNDTRVSWKSA